MPAYQIFLFTAAISFAGSLQPGQLNLVVIRASLKNNLRGAFMISAGGCIPELFYASVALAFVSYLNTHSGLLMYFDMAVVPVLLIIGLFFLLKKKKQVSAEPETRKISFVKGFLLALFNPQLLPFWFTILLYINSMSEINSAAEKFAFVTGTASGTAALLLFYGWLAYRKKEMINKFLGKLNFDRLLGIILTGLAVIKLFSFGF